MVESKTYTDSIKFFAVKEPIFLFLSFYSCPKEETHVVSAVFALLQTKRYVLRRGKGLERLERVLCFRNMYWDGSGIGYLFQMSRLVKCVMTPRHWLRPRCLNTSPHQESLKTRQNTHQSWISIVFAILLTKMFRDDDNQPKYPPSFPSHAFFIRF